MYRPFPVAKFGQQRCTFDVLTHHATVLPVLLQKRYITAVSVVLSTMAFDIGSTPFTGAWEPLSPDMLCTPMHRPKLGLFRTKLQDLMLVAGLHIPLGACRPNPPGSRREVVCIDLATKWNRGAPLAASIVYELETHIAERP
jgi:hypothetical protein